MSDGRSEEIDIQKGSHGTLAKFQVVQRTEKIGRNRRKGKVTGLQETKKERKKKKEIGQKRRRRRVQRRLEKGSISSFRSRSAILDPSSLRRKGQGGWNRFSVGERAASTQFFNGSAIIFPCSRQTAQHRKSRFWFFKFFIEKITFRHTASSDLMSDGRSEEIDIQKGSHGTLAKFQVVQRTLPEQSREGEGWRGLVLEKPGSWFAWVGKHSCCNTSDDCEMVTYTLHAWRGSSSKHKSDRLKGRLTNAINKRAIPLVPAGNSSFSDSRETSYDWCHLGRKCRKDKECRPTKQWQIHCIKVATGSKVGRAGAAA